MAWGPWYGTCMEPTQPQLCCGRQTPQILLFSDQTLVLINLIPVYPPSCKNPCPWIFMPSFSTPLLTVIHTTPTTLHHSLKTWTPGSQLLFPWHQCSREYVQPTSMLQRSASPTHFSPWLPWSHIGSHHHIELFVLWNVKFLPLQNGFCYDHFIHNVFTVLTNVFLKYSFFWLCQVIVVACRIFNHCCDVWNLVGVGIKCGNGLPFLHCTAIWFGRYHNRIR